MKIDTLIWEELLNLKKNPSNKSCSGWSFDDKSFYEITDDSAIKSDHDALLLKSDRDLTAVTLSSYQHIDIPYEGLSLFVSLDMPDGLLAILQNYWPISVLSHLNRQLPYIFIHSAISMDGYLATSSGHSRWIGNEENLIHAHRLRALLDAVLVGGKTVVMDKPSLDVRRVKGNNPKRLVLSNQSNDLSSLQKNANCQTYLLRDSKYKYDNCNNQFDKILFFEGASKEDKMLDLLLKCKEENITSILVEGGGSTLSSFIETKFAETIQFHISPMLFGSGIKAVQLAKVNLVNESQELQKMLITPMGNSFMVTAQLV